MQGSPGSAPPLLAAPRLLGLLEKRWRCAQQRMQQPIKLPQLLPVQSGVLSGRQTRRPSCWHATERPDPIGVLTQIAPLLLSPQTAQQATREPLTAFHFCLRGPCSPDTALQVCRQPSHA